MNKETSEFLELIHLTPATRVLEISSHADDLSQALAEHLQTVEGEFHLQLYPGLHNVPEMANVKFGDVKDFNSPFRAIAREYSAIVLRDVLDAHKFPDRIIKATYKSLLNATELIIVQKKGSMSIEKMKEFLDSNEFRAANEIDIFEDYHVVVGKKMHMWGNGL